MHLSSNLYILSVLCVRIVHPVKESCLLFCCIERVALKSGQCRVINRSYLFTCGASTSRPRAPRPRPAPCRVVPPRVGRHRGPSRGPRLSLAVHPVFRFVLNSTLTLYTCVCAINCLHIICLL